MKFQFKRILLLMLAAVTLASLLSGCFTFSFDDLLGFAKPKEETSGGPLFNPDGDDDPLSDAAEATGASTFPTESRPTPGPTEPANPTTEPTQAPTEPSTEPTTEPTTAPTEPPLGNPICYGVVIGDRVNVRTGPGTNYGVIRLTYEFDRVAIYERDGDWGRIKDGWVHMDYVYIDGTIGPDGSMMATVIGDIVNIRSGPGTDYAVVRTVKEDDEIEVLYVGYFDNRYWGCTKYGWICTSYLYFGN